MKLLINTNTGTIEELEGCVVVDTEKLNDHQSAVFNDGDDNAIVEMAKEVGLSLTQLFHETEDGTLRARNSISFTPNALREEAKMVLDNSIQHPDDAKMTGWLNWAISEATDEELNYIAELIMLEDELWEDIDYSNRLTANLFYYFTEVKR